MDLTVLHGSLTSTCSIGVNPFVSNGFELIASAVGFSHIVGKSTYLKHGCSNRDIKRSAVAVSKKLLFKFDAEIRAIRKRQDEEEAAIYSASVLYSDYKAEYMASMGALSTKARNKKEAQIQGVVAFLGSKPIEQIRQADVKQPIYMKFSIVYLKFKKFQVSL